MAAAEGLPEAELEKQLVEVGNQLLSPPSSSTTPELLAILDRVEHLLSLVEQSPSESMREALSSSTKALIAKDLLRHSDVDIKVAVAACISEITRITAPDAPYEDEQMKEVFQLIVSSFEKLDDTDSPSYSKRVNILETVAKVRSCVVMLDLECDALIVEMFQHFLKSVRDNHNDKVISSLETIMTLVLEESEEIAPDLLSPILNVLKKENKEVLASARQLGEKVLGNCAGKVKPFLLQALRSCGDSIDDYCKAVSDVCQAGTEAVEPSDGDTAGKNLADENDSVNTPSEKAVEVAVETLEDAPPEEVGPSTVGSPNSVMSNGTLQKEIDDSSAANGNSKDEDPDTHATKLEPNKSDVDAEEPVKLRAKPEKSSRRKGRKSHPSKSSSSEPSELAVLDSKPAKVKEPVHEENNIEDADNTPSEDPMVETAEPAVKEKAHESPVSSPKLSDKEPVDSSPSASGSLADEAHLKKAGRGRKKGDKKSEAATAIVDSKKASDTKKLSRGAAVPESKSSKRSGKSPSTAPDRKGNLSDGKKREDENPGESETESDMDVDKKIEGGTRQRGEKKKQGQAKTPSKVHSKTPVKDGKKKSAVPKSTPKSMDDDSGTERASKSSSKRKRPREEKAPETKVYGPELLGSVIKVWWQLDQKYYKGVVSDYDPAKKTHEVKYDDGDIEVLKLKKERWILVAGNFTNQEHTSDGESADESADETPKGKKAKTGSDQGAKRGKTVSTTNKSGASSSKSKATSKSGSKQKEHSKIDDKSEESPWNLGKSDGGAKGGKSKVSKSGNKLTDTPKSSRKANNDDEDTSKTSKSKQDTAKGAAKSKGKLPKSVGRVKLGGSGKAKADSSAEEDDTEDEQSPDPGNSKGKSHGTPKSQKNSKKRKR